MSTAAQGLVVLTGATMSTHFKFRPPPPFQLAKAAFLLRFIYMRHREKKDEERGRKGACVKKNIERQQLANKFILQLEKPRQTLLRPSQCRGNTFCAISNSAGIPLLPKRCSL